MLSKLYQNWCNHNGDPVQNYSFDIIKSVEYIYQIRSDIYIQEQANPEIGSQLFKICHNFGILTKEDISTSTSTGLNDKYDICLPNSNTARCIPNIISSLESIKIDKQYIEPSILHIKD